VPLRVLVGCGWGGAVLGPQRATRLDLLLWADCAGVPLMTVLWWSVRTIGDRIEYKQNREDSFRLTGEVSCTIDNLVGVCV